MAAEQSLPLAPPRRATGLVDVFAPRRLLTGLLALVLAFLSQLRFATQPPDLVAGLISFALAALLLNWAIPATGPDNWYLAGRWPNLMAVRLPYLLTIGAAAVLAASLFVFGGNTNPGLGWILYLAAVAVLALAASLLPDGERVHINPGIGAAEIALVVIIALLGLGLRLWHLDTLPFGDWYDEAVAGLAAQHILNDPNYRPVFFVEGQIPALFLYPIAAAFKVFGQNPFAVRFTVAVMGTLAIPSMFLLARRLFGSPRIALVAAFFVAVASWHITLSRFPTNSAMYTVTFDLLTIYFVVRGIQDRRPRDFVFAGLIYGFDNQGYFPARLLIAALGVLALWVFVRRAELRRPVLLGTLLFAVGLGVALGPLVQFAVRYPDDFNKRLGVASIMPEIQKAGNLNPLKSNIEKHLLMFNVQGDPNGRHNLPGRPMLDGFMAPLFVLGLGLAILGILRPTGALLLSWWGVMLLGGILSLAFEAPQSLRSSGAISPTLLLAAIPLGALWDRWVRSPWGTYGNANLAATAPREAIGPRALFLGAWPALPARWHGPGRTTRTTRALLPVLFLALLLVIGWRNYQRYFVAWANDFSAWAAHSTPETIVAQRLQKLGPDTDIYVSQFYFGQPPAVRFLAPNAPPVKLFNAGADLPVQSGGRPVVFLLDPQEQAAALELRQYYPTAKFEDVTPPFGGPPVVRVITLTPQDVASVQGVEARYYSGGEVKPQPDLARREAAVDVDPAALGLALPVLGDWRGTLQLPEFGQYTFTLDGPADAELFLNRTRIVSGPGSGQATLARGNYALVLHATFTGPGQALRLHWQGPNGVAGIVPQAQFFLPPVAATGLLGTYYKSNDWSGPPALMRIDPQIGTYIHVIPLPRPYTVEWKGKLRIDQAGVYRFGTEQISTSQLFIDEKLIIDNQAGNQLREAEVQLQPGLHDIRVRFADRDGYSHIYLYWTAPGRSREIIPSQFLLPPQGDDLPADEASIGTTPLPAGNAPAPPPAVKIPTGLINFGKEVPLPATFAVTYGIGDQRLNAPRDAAIAPDGRVYVLDSGNNRVVVFNADGSFDKAFGGTAAGQGGLKEPVGLVLDSAGITCVLDASTNTIQQYNPDGSYIGKVNLERADFYNPRGLAIDGSDNLYVADTGMNRVVRFTRAGKVAVIYGGTKGNGPGQFLEPTDSVLLPDGSVMILDTGNKRLQWLDATGRYRAEWPINFSVPLSGPHLVLDGEGRVVVTDPDRGRLVRYNPQTGESWAIGTKGLGPGQFQLPVGIARDAAGDLLVIDTGANRAVLLQPLD